MPGRRGRGTRYDTQAPTIPLDALVEFGDAVHHVEPGKGESGRAAKAVAHARCPLHRDPKPVALVWDGGHWSWREHTYRTWSGAPFTCGASLMRLCELRAMPIPGENTPTCPCGGVHR